ncbi:MAG TPA: putative zinc-binding metallopeptidase [Rhizobiaceae bacterium]|nr:putative zinc-binding metallopeptidase [Rhizobiaceae bacterium]
MKLFSCPTCGNRLYFENQQCLSCGTMVAFSAPEDRFIPLPSGGYFACANGAECACNWAVTTDGLFCEACVLNRTIPDLSVDGNRARWIEVEAAKRRVIYWLMRRGLAVVPKASSGDEAGLAFAFLADGFGAGLAEERILTGYESGLVTLNLAEADAPYREMMRIEMGERYRTLLGHFRHEIGHYYWDRLIRDDPEWLDRARALFGDDTLDYAQALQRHYDEGPPARWEGSFITPYAASHPWEDWAETWAHYMHISDTLEMVAVLNMPLGRLNVESAEELPPNEGDFADKPAIAPEMPDLVSPEAFDDLLARWLVLAEAANCINRCMGMRDLYPFVISDMVSEKLRFVHELLAEKGGFPA